MDLLHLTGFFFLNKSAPWRLNLRLLRSICKNTEVLIQSCAKTDVFVWELNQEAELPSSCNSVKSIFDLFFSFLQCDSIIYDLPAWVYVSNSHTLWHEFFLLLSTVNPCCYFPCQHWGLCVRYTEDKYECDCTRTGYYGENCTVRELPSWDQLSYPHLLLHFSGIWNILLFLCT